MDPLDVLQRPFHERARVSAPWAWVSFGAPRWLVTLGFAAVPGALALLGAALLPAEFLRTLIDPSRVHDTFARFVGAVATAAAIAVSIVTLTLGRQLRGIHNLEEHLHVDEEFRDRIRRGRSGLPLSLGGVLSVTYQDVAQAARDVREHATPDELAHEAEGVRLDELLRVLQEEATRAADATLRRRQDPDRMIAAALEFEEELASHYVRRFRRSDALDAGTCGRLTALRDRLDEATIARSYAKTLDTQFGLSRMSGTLLVSAFAAVFVAAAMVLTYGDGVRAAWGDWGAALLVAAALSTVAFPLATFVSYLLRFVFLNAHTLPTRGFVLGRELETREEATPSRGTRTRTARRA